MSDLGRFQKGDRVVIEVATPTLPDAHPVAAIVDANSHPIGSFEMAYAPDIAGFRVTLRLGAEYGSGSYGVNVTYAVAGDAQTASSTFEVVAGGDPGGPVISLYSYDRPEGRYTLAQLGGGRLVQGRNPKL